MGEWSCNCTKTKNPDEIRVCGDYRRVNEAIKTEYHPMPTIDELTDDMSGAAYSLVWIYEVDTIRLR